MLWTFARTPFSKPSSSWTAFGTPAGSRGGCSPSPATSAWPTSAPGSGGPRTAKGPAPQGLDAFQAERSPARLGDLRELEPPELRLLVEGALDRLSFEQREAVVLKVFEGLRFDEIAGIAGCPLSTAKSRMYLGLSRLKSILNNDPGRKS